MWYYARDRKPFGPENIRGITQAIEAGLIQADTMICRKDSYNWVPIGQSELAFLFGMQPVEDDFLTDQPVQEEQEPDEAVRKKARLARQARKALVGLNVAFWIWAALIVTGLAILLVNLRGGLSIIAGLTALISLLPLVMAWVPNLIQLYQHWKIIQDRHAKVTSGRALGFMFIPLFNYYWLLPAYYGLSKTQNQYIARHFKGSRGSWASRSHPWLAIVWVVCTWLGTLLILYEAVVLILSFSGRLTLQLPLTLLDPLTLRLMTGLFLTQLGFQILMMVDLYLTSRAILKGKANS